MFVLRKIVTCAALIAALLATGCGRTSSTVTPDETTDPLYAQAHELNKQGRRNEALSQFLKVIERRGESGAPESHLEAANLYLNWAKDPISAYYHFRRYLALNPTSPKADIVRGQIELARREFARTLPGGGDDLLRYRPPTDDIAQLQRRVQELEAEIQTLRGSAAAPVRRALPVIQVDEPEYLEPPAADPTPPASNAAAVAGGPIAAPAPTVQPPMERPPAATTGRPVPPTRPGTQPAQSAPASRTHTVRQRESLWSIGRQYYGSSVTAAKVQGIYYANQDVMRHEQDVRPGMVLRIP